MSHRGNSISLLNSISIRLRLEEIEASASARSDVGTVKEASGSSLTLSRYPETPGQEKRGLQERPRRGKGTLGLSEDRLRMGAPMTRSETAEYLRLSTRTIQRMEAAGKLPRCSGFGTVVRYAARDVLRLASAQ